MTIYYFFSETNYIRKENLYLVFISSFISITCMQLRYIANLFKEIIGLGLGKTWTTLLDSDQLYDILDLDLESI